MGVEVFVPQIALAIGVLTSSIGVRVRRFCGFVVGGLSHRVLLELSSGVWVRVRRSKKGAVTQGVVGAVVWCVFG